MRTWVCSSGRPPSSWSRLVVGVEVFVENSDDVVVANEVVTVVDPLFIDISCCVERASFLHNSQSCISTGNRAAVSRTFVFCFRFGYLVYTLAYLTNIKSGKKSKACTGIIIIVKYSSAMAIADNAGLCYRCSRDLGVDRTDLSPNFPLRRRF